MKVILGKPALADLDDIAEWIGKDSDAKAREFSRDLRDRCHELNDRATLYHVAEGLEDQGIRRRLYRKYLIFYRVAVDHVEIVRVIHGSRDWLPMLLETE